MKIIDRHRSAANDGLAKNSNGGKMAKAASATASAGCLRKQQKINNHQSMAAASKVRQASEEEWWMAADRCDGHSAKQWRKRKAGISLITLAAPGETTLSLPASSAGVARAYRAGAIAHLPGSIARGGIWRSGEIFVSSLY